MLKEAKKTIQGQHEDMSEGLPEFRRNTLLSLCVCVCVCVCVGWRDREGERKRGRLYMFKLRAVYNCDDAAFELKLPLCCVRHTVWSCVARVCLHVYKYMYLRREESHLSSVCVWDALIFTIPIVGLSFSHSRTHTHFCWFPCMCVWVSL